MFLWYRNWWKSKFEYFIISTHLKRFSSWFLVGRITFELYNDICPITCKNFLYYCRSTDDKLSYKRCLFHRIVKNFMIQSGDFTQGKWLEITRQKKQIYIYIVCSTKDKRRQSHIIDVFFCFIFINFLFFCLISHSICVSIVVLFCVE